MNYPGLKEYSKADIDEWIELARRYLRKDKALPAGMMELAGEIFRIDLTLGIYFYAEIRRYPSLKKTIMHGAPDEQEPASDDPLIFFKHPGREKARSIADQMFR